MLKMITKIKSMYDINWTITERYVDVFLMQKLRDYVMFIDKNTANVAYIIMVGFHFRRHTSDILW